MGLLRRDGRDGGLSDYAWAHDPGLSGGPLGKALVGKIMLAQCHHGGMDGWHGAEPEGRWTNGLAVFPVSAEPGWSQVRIACVNHHAKPQVVDFTLGTEARREIIEPREEREVIVPRSTTGDRLTIACTPIKPSTYGANDDRELGIFVKSIEFCE